MSTEPEPEKPANPTLLAALYQVTARWYANDAQLIWRRIALFATLNTGLLTAQAFASQLHLGIRLALAFLGVAFSAYWLALIRRTWRYQDFQAAVLRDQERAMGLEELGAFSRVWTIRNQSPFAEIQISGMDFHGSQFTGSLRNREFMKFLVWVFILFHAALLYAAIVGWSLQAKGALVTSTPAPSTTPKFAATPQPTPPARSASPKFAATPQPTSPPQPATSTPQHSPSTSRAP